MKVLVAFDGSSPSRTCLDLVDEIAWPAGTRIELVHVLPSLTVLGGFAVPPPAAGTHLPDLVKLAQAHRRPGVDVVAKTVTGGSVAEALLGEARALGADLIIAGHRGHGPLATVFLGSVARDLAEHAHCPVLIARGPRIAKAVFAEDGSESAYRARKLLVRWPIFGGAEVRVVAVSQIARPLLSGVTAGVYEEAREAQRELEVETRHAYSVLAEEAAADLRVAGIVASAMVREGDPAAQIVECAKHAGADVIVIGTRGRGSVTRAMLGSVARAVLLTAPCSVLVVPSA